MEQGKEAMDILAVCLVIHSQQAGLQVGQHGAGPVKNRVHDGPVSLDEHGLVIAALNPDFAEARQAIAGDEAS
ncbi:MAG: hypothetical protein Q8O14_07870, partial [bacterium]|nr:hypothetical protein [bacterium]